MASSLDPSQMMARMQQMRNQDPADAVAQMIEDQDADGDGGLSIEELSGDGMGMPAEMFSQIDADGDGILTSDELTTDLEDRQAKMAEMGPPPDLAAMFGESDSEPTWQSVGQAQSAYQNSDMSALLARFGGSSTLESLDLSA
jgi:Ca2+-binding EF-hand superfamily protein